MINKRGVSAIIATVLVILITITAAALVSQFVIPFVKNNLEKGGECVPYRDYFKFEESFSYQGNAYYYNCENNGSYGVIVSAESGIDSSKIKGFSISFSNGVESKKVNILSDALIGEAKMLNSSDNLIVPSPGETRTYVANIGKTEMKSAEIYPILINDRVCEKTDEIKITKCASGTILS